MEQVKGEGLKLGGAELGGDAALTHGFGCMCLVVAALGCSFCLL